MKNKTVQHPAWTKDSDHESVLTFMKSATQRENLSSGMRSENTQACFANYKDYLEYEYFDVSSLGLLSPKHRRTIAWISLRMRCAG